MQSEEVGFQSAFERGQRLGCSDVHRKVIPPSWGQNREQEITRNLCQYVEIKCIN